MPVSNPAHLYCYGPQRLCIINDLCSIGFDVDLRRLHVVDEHSFYMLRGLNRYATFINSATHPRQIPEVMMKEIMAQGMVMLTLNDRFSRQRYERERS